MNVHELTRDQITELKQKMLTDRMAEHDEEPSYGELADVDEVISDEEVFSEFEGTEFTNDDFFCTAGLDDE